MLSYTESKRIVILRPMLIFLVLMAHVPGNLYRPDLRGVEDPRLVDFINALLSGAVSMLALPTLSFISGYLAWKSYQKKAYLWLVLKKSWVLLVPMLLWGFFMAVFVYSKQAQGIPFRADLELYPASFSAWLKVLVGYKVLPANPPLYFLKELFFAILVLPAYVLLSKNRLTTVLFFMFIFVMSQLERDFGLFVRIEVQMYFVMGLYVAMHWGLSALDNALRRYEVFLYLGFVVGSLAVTYHAIMGGGEHYIMLVRAFTVIGPLVFWLLSARLLDTLLGRALALLSPVSFTMFLSHVLVMNLMWDLWIYLFKDTPYNAYPAFWLTTMGACLVAAIVVWWIYQRLSGSLRIFSRNFYSN